MPRVKVPVPKSDTQPAETTPVVEAPAQVNPGVPFTQRFTRQQLIMGAVGLVFLIMFAMLLNLMSDRNKLQSQVSKLSNPSSASSDEVKQLTKEISAFFELPTGETPTLATVSDASKVRNQAFFKNAQNGDKVLLYSKAGEAVLYRPSTKKIISVAPVNLNGTDTANSGGSTTTDATSTTK